MNDNAYKIDLPEDYTVSPTFNVRDLTPYLEDGVGVEDDVDLRENPFQLGGYDVPHHGRSDPSSPREEESKLESPMVQDESYKGPINQSRAKFVNLVTYLDNKEACEA